MDNLGILVQAILSLKDTKASKDQIAKELPKLESQLQSDKNTRVKIVAGLDIAKSKNLIQSQLNTLANQAKAPTIKIGVDTSGLNSVQGATQNITNNLKNVQTQAQQTANSVKQVGQELSVNITDTSINKINKAFHVSSKVTDEYRNNLKALATELTTAWNTYDEDKYYQTLRKIIDLIGQFQIKHKAISTSSSDYSNLIKQISILEQSIGYRLKDSNRFVIDPKFRAELEYVTGGFEKLKSILNSVFGRKWTFNTNLSGTNLRNFLDAQSVGIAGLDTNYGKYAESQYGGANQARYFVETYEKLMELKAQAKATISDFDAMWNAVASPEDEQLFIKNIENVIAEILKLNNYTQRTNDPFGWFEPIIDEANTASQSISTLTNNISALQNTANNSTSAMANVKNATDSVVNANTQVTNSAKYISTEYKTSFDVVSNAIKQAKLEFKKFGEVSAVSNKSVKAFDGVPEHFKDFTIQVKSASGEVKKFFYTFENVGDKDNPVFKYMLQNINEADAGVKKLIDDIEKAKANAQKTLAGFNNKSLGLFNQTDVYKNALNASQNITNFDDIAKFNNAMAELEAHYQKITAYTRSGSKSLNPFINAVNDMAGMEEQIKRIKASADGLQNKSKSLIGNLGSLNRLADNVNKHAVGTEEWGQAYEKLKNKIAQVNDQIKTAKVEQKTTDSFAQKQQNMYSVIEQRMKQINQLKIQQLSTDESTSRIIQEQINSYTNQINGIKGNMSKYGYGDKTLDKEVEKLKVELDYKYRIAQSEKENRVQQQSNNELLKFQTDTLREINAEYEKIVANKRAMASSKSEENKSIYANRIAESEKIIANDMEMLKDANLLTEEINQQVASKRQYVVEQEKIIANTAQIKREQELNQVFKSQITEVEKYKNSINETIDTLQRLQNSSTFTKNASNPQVTEEKNKISALIAEYQKLITQLNGNVTPAGLEDINNRLNELNARFNDATTTAKRFETELRSDNGADQLAQKVTLLTQRIKAYRQANSKSEKLFGSQYDSMLSQLANPNIDLNTYNALNKQFQKMRQEINSANVAGKNLWQTLKEKVAKFTGWMSMTYAISLATRTIRGMVTDVVELDTALVDLKKTFRGTETDLRNLYISANETAKQLGVTTKDILEQASAWSRLGYSNAEAAETMAKNSAIFRTISPGMDLDTATDGLVSMMKAFDIEANDVLDGIMSKVNIIGNKFATDNSSIVEAMTRSSAAMAAANNTLEETIALNTASIEITRNAETTANAWKTNFYCLYVQKCA